MSCKKVCHSSPHAALLTSIVVAPGLYHIFKLGHSRAHLDRLMDSVAKACEERFDRMLGPYTFDCQHFLREAVSLSVRLLFHLLHPVHRYDLDYSENAEVYKAKAMNVLKGSDQHIILPAIRIGGRTVSRALAYYNWINCEQCLVST